MSVDSGGAHRAHAGLSRFRTPFRVGSTSYVYPDDILPNVERLAAAGDVDDIELVLFEVDDGPNNLPDERTITALMDLAYRHALTYTVHLPLDLALGAGAGTLESHRSLVKAERVIRTTAPLNPFAYVFHLDGVGVGEAGWADRAVRALELIIPLAGAPERMAVENLESWDPAYLTPVLDALPISRTTDIGHFWKMGRDPLAVLESWLPRTRVIHLHGLAERDHKSLAHVPPAQLDPVVRQLMAAAFAGVVTLEVFDTDDFFSSRAALLESVERVRRG